MKGDCPFCSLPAPVSPVAFVSQAHTSHCLLIRVAACFIYSNGLNVNSSLKEMSFQDELPFSNDWRVCWVLASLQSQMLS